MTDFRNFFQGMRRTRRMYVSSDRYEVLVAFVCGYNAATGGDLLAGFQQWVVSKITEHPTSNLSWVNWVAEKQAPGMLHKPLSALPEECDEAASNLLFDLLDEFLAERGR